MKVILLEPTLVGGDIPGRSLATLRGFSVRLEVGSGFGWQFRAETPPLYPIVELQTKFKQWKETSTLDKLSSEFCECRWTHSLLQIRFAHESPLVTFAVKQKCVVQISHSSLQSWPHQPLWPWRFSFEPTMINRKEDGDEGIVVQNLNTNLKSVCSHGKNDTRPCWNGIELGNAGFQVDCIRDPMFSIGISNCFGYFWDVWKLLSDFTPIWSRNHLTWIMKVFCCFWFNTD